MIIPVNALFLTLLLLATFSDIKWRIIPDFLPVMIAFMALPSFQIWGGLLALPFLVVPMMSPGKVGGGDIKLVAAIGVFLGYHTTLLALILAISTLILLYFASLGFKNPKKLNDLSAPLAPYLTFGVALTYLI